MTLFLTRYFLNELSAWLVFIPLLFSPVLFIGSLTGSPFYFILMMVIFSSTVVFSKYSESRKNYARTLILAPISFKKIVQADFAFLSWVSFCYLSYAFVTITTLTLLIEKEWIFPSVNQLSFIIGCSLLLISFNSWLLSLHFVPINILPITILLLSMLFRMTDITLFATVYGIYFFILTIVLTIISYFGTITIQIRRLKFT